MFRRIGLAAVAIAVATMVAPNGSSVLPAAAAPEPTVHWSDADGLSAGMATTTTTTTVTYRFSTYVNSKPVRWNPCKPIHWRYNPAGQPVWNLSDGRRITGFHVIRSALAKVALATGTTWVYDGTTSSPPTSKWLPTSVATIRPVLFGWSDRYHSDLLSGQSSSTVAVTRTAYFKTTVDGVTKAATKGMVVAFDRTHRLPPTGAQSWRSVALHEISHGMGLAHVSTTSQMMYPMLLTKYTELQSGDRTGLYKLGISRGCINLGF